MICPVNATETRSIAAAYLAGDPQVTSWFNGEWRSLADLQSWWGAQRSQTWPRAQLQAIASTAMDYGSTAQRQAARALGESEVSCVVTGQQPALGGGPLYTLLKTAHAIALAEQLTAAGQPCVAVFWCASEDHDAGEADHADLIDHQGRVHRRRIALRQPGASTRHQPASEGYNDLLAACHQLAPNGLGAAWLTALAPQADEGLGAWLCRLIAGVFPNAPLICLEAHQLRPLWAERRPSIESAWPRAALEDRRQEILMAGYPDALGPLPYPPFFCDSPSARSAIDPGTPCAADALSSGAALRPILQQICLPCCAYVGGPGEIAYHAQLGPAYDALGATMPRLIPRLGGALLGPRLARGCAQWQIDPASISSATAEPCLASPVDLSQLDAAIAALTATDQATERRLATARQRLQRERERLAASLQRGERQRQQRPAFATLRDQLFPRGLPQERVMSSFQAIWEHGPGLGQILIDQAKAPDPHLNRLFRLSDRQT